MSPSSPPPASGPAREVVLHVGTGKAGSSSLQAFCRMNGDRLAALGLLYPTAPGKRRHTAISMAVKSDAELAVTPAWQRRKQHDQDRFRRRLRRRLLHEIEESGSPRVLLSDEELFGLSDQALGRLGTLGRQLTDRLRLVAYVRRQDDHLVSRYQQGVKIGWVARLSEWATSDFSGLYDYDDRLRRHERLVAPTDVVVRPFEPGAFSGGSLYQDFLDTVGVAARAEDLAQVADRNLSLDAESVEFLRLLNLHRVTHEGAEAGLIDNRALVPRLAGAATGPTLTLPEPLLDRFMSQWEEPNRRLATDYLGAADGQLFRQPRKTRDTTTEQRLDPARIDHFLALADLPERLRTPLRRLAELEASPSRTRPGR